jgi:hypothetical protein
MRFHRRPEYAVARLGYDSTELANVPLSVTSSFAGVGNPHAIAPIHEAAGFRDVHIVARSIVLRARPKSGPQGATASAA